METTQKDLYIEGFSSGANTDIVFEWTVTLEYGEGIPLTNIDSATSNFHIKRVYSDTTPLLSANVGNGITVVPANGAVKLALTIQHFDQFSYNIDEQDFVYDWDLTDDLGRKFRLYKGNITLGGDL